MVNWLKLQWKTIGILLILLLINGFVLASSNKKSRVVRPPSKSSHSAAAASEKQEPSDHDSAAESEAGEHHEAEASGLAAIEPGFILHLTIPGLFPKNPDCDHSKMKLFQKFHHVSPCGVPNVVTVSWLVMILLVTLSIRGTRDMKMVPGRLQCFLEFIVDGLIGMVEGTIGHNGRLYLPLIGTLAMYIFLCNMAGLVPGLTSPSANLSNNVALALIVFFFTHYAGFRHQGVGYLKHFAGPMPALAPLMIPLHVIGELARPLSLSMRLFGNIFGEEMVIMILLLLAPFGVPFLMMAFAVFGGSIQTAVFVLLSTVYIAGAAAHAE